MRYFFLSLSILLFVQMGFSQDNNSNTASRIIQNLDRIESLYIKYLNFQEQQEAVKLLNETRNLIMNSPIISLSQNDLNILNEASFLSLLDSVKKEVSDRSKTILIKAIGKRGKITCTQLSQLIALYSFDSNREELLMSIADSIIDPVNIGIVLKYFDSSITREKLAEYFRGR
jgi:hypothetical protein